MTKTNQQNNQQYHIDVQFADSNKEKPDVNDFLLWAETALAPHVVEAEVTIRVVNTDEITKLNDDFRCKNKATNVLSFPAPPDIKAKTNLLGDVIICSDVVNREAKEQHKEQQAHWAHMTIHGILHLLGYDHTEDDEAEAMEDLEKRLLASLGYQDPYVIGEMIDKHE